MAVERLARDLKKKNGRLLRNFRTILNLASLLNFQSTNVINKFAPISFKRLVGLNQMLGRLTLEQRGKLADISPSRAEVIVAGGQILEGVMRSLKIQTLEPCSFALREGVIIDYLREIEAESLPPVPEVDDGNLRGVFAVGRRFGYEEKHALQVAFLAEKMFDALAPAYKMDRHWRTLLSAAAILHDVGFHISHESHHKHSFYLIKHSELTGFSEAEKHLIANIARYHRGNIPRDKHHDFIVLSEKDREIVWKLGAILRLAEALDRSYESKVSDLHLTRSKQNMSFEIVGKTNLESELNSFEKKKDMFEQAFSRKVSVKIKSV